MARHPVFVSYSQSDHDIALSLVAYLEAQGLECWVAPRDIAPGADWAEEIVNAIAAARVMVLVFSASANTSPQVRREVERAVHREVAVLPFRVADVVPSKSLEYFLSSQHWMDAFPLPMEPHYARLCTYLKALLSPAAATLPAPESTAIASPASAPAAPAPSAAPVRAAATTVTTTATRLAGADSGPSAATLQRLERELARYIGPVARLLVSRAARRTSGIEALILDLGAEIESESDRREFINASRQSLRGAT